MKKISEFNSMNDQQKCAVKEYHEVVKCLKVCQKNNNFCVWEYLFSESQRLVKKLNALGVTII